MAKRKTFNNHKRQRIFNKTHGHCGYCGCKITPDNFQVDHITPLAKGGSNYEFNLIASCSLCNKYKGALSVVEFKKRILEQVEVIRKSNGKFRLLEHMGIVWVREDGISFFFERQKC